MQRGTQASAASVSPRSVVRHLHRRHLGQRTNLDQLCTRSAFPPAGSPRPGRAATHQFGEARLWLIPLAAPAGSLVFVRSTPRKRVAKCPVPNTHDKIEEAHYFLHMAAEHYHWPDPFRWNLNAFLQALRSTTHYLEREQDQIPNFQDWYPPKRAANDRNELLSRFRKGRNVIVHEQALLAKSRAWTGAFDYGREVRVAIQADVDPLIPSDALLRRARRTEFMKLTLRGRRSEGWQAGAEREWVVEELGDSEVTSLGLEAFHGIAEVVGEAHALAKVKWGVPDECGEVLAYRRTMLEEDLPPVHKRARPKN
jgi:hypothetical protein